MNLFFVDDGRVGTLDWLVLTRPTRMRPELDMPPIASIDMWPFISGAVQTSELTRPVDFVLRTLSGKNPPEMNA